MRIGGAFAANPASVEVGGGIVTLRPGGMFYPPSGTYVFQSGLTTVAQYYDPIGGWRNLTPPSMDPLFLSCDGANVRLVNLSGCVIGAAISNAGSGGTNGIGSTATGVSLTFGASTPAVRGYPIVGGSVAAPTITAGGSGFTATPYIVCDPPPPGGVQATAVCTISAAGAINSIFMVSAGAGYLTTPNWYVIPQSPYYQGGLSGDIAAAPITEAGDVYPDNLPYALRNSFQSDVNGARLTSNPLTGSGTLTAIVIFQYGGDITGTTIPSLTITGCGAAAGSCIPSLSVTAIAVSIAGAGYGAGAAPTWVSAQPIVTRLYNNNRIMERPARGVTTLSAGGVATAVVEDVGFGLAAAPAIAVINTSAIATTQAVLTPTVAGINDTSYLQPMAP